MVLLSYFTVSFLLVYLVLNKRKDLLVTILVTCLCQNPCDSIQEAIIFVPGSGGRHGDNILLQESFLRFSLEVALDVF